MSTETRNAKIQELRDQTGRALKEITELETHIAGIPGFVGDGDGDKANEYWFAAADIHNRLLKIIDTDVAFLLSDLVPYEEPPYDANEYQWSISSLDDAVNVLRTVQYSLLWREHNGNKPEIGTDFINGLCDGIRAAQESVENRRFKEAQEAIENELAAVKVLAGAVDFESRPHEHFTVVVAQSLMERAHDLVCHIIKEIQEAKK